MRLLLHVVWPSAGLDYYCPDGLTIHNSGNTPMSVAALSASALLPNGLPCQHGDLQPEEAAYCDVAWTLSQAELKFGTTYVQMTVQGNDTGSPTSSFDYTASTAVPVPQAPGLSVKLYQAESVGVVTPGRLPAAVLSMLRLLLGFLQNSYNSAFDIGAVQLHP